MRYGSISRKVLPREEVSFCFSNILHGLFKTFSFHGTGLKFWETRKVLQLLSEITYGSFCFCPLFATNTFPATTAFIPADYKLLLGAYMFSVSIKVAYV